MHSRKPKPYVSRSPSMKLILRKNTKLVYTGKKLKLHSVMGITTQSNANFCISSNDCCIYIAGSSIAIFNIRTKSTDYLTINGKKALSSCSLSVDGKYLFVGECGQQPALRVWDIKEKLEIAQFYSHKYDIASVGITPNGKYLISIGSPHDMSVNVWDWSTKSKIACNKISTQVKAMTISQDSTYFVTAGVKHVKFWSLNFGPNMTSMMSSSISFPSSNYSADSFGGSMQSLDGMTNNNNYCNNAGYPSGLRTNEPIPLIGRAAILRELRNETFQDVKCGSNQNSDKIYAITTTGILCLFLGPPHRQLDKMIETKCESTFAISANEGVLICACSQGIIQLYDANNLDFISHILQPIPYGLAFPTMPESYQTSPLKGMRYADCVACGIDQNHNITAVYNDHSFYVWELAKPLKDQSSPYLLTYYQKFHAACVWSIANCILMPNDNIGENDIMCPLLMTVSYDGCIRCWIVPQNTCEQNSENHQNGLNMKIFDTLKLLYVIDLNEYDDTSENNNNLRNIQGREDSPNNVKQGSVMGIRSLAISYDGNFISVGDKIGNIRIFRCCDMSLIDILEAHDGEIVSLDYSAAQNTTNGGSITSHFLASGSKDRLIHIFQQNFIRENFDSNNNDNNSIHVSDNIVIQHFQTLNDHSAPICNIKFVHVNPYNRTNICPYHSTSFIEQANSFEKNMNNGVSHCECKLLLISCAADKSILIREAIYENMDSGVHSVTRENSVDTPEHSNHIVSFVILHTITNLCYLYDIDINPTGTILAAACQDRFIRFYDVYDGKLINAMKGSPQEEGILIKVAFDPSSQYVAVSSSDKTVYILDCATGEIMANITSFSELVICLKFSMDAKYLYTATFDGCLQEWDIPNEVSVKISEKLSAIHSRNVLPISGQKIFSNALWSNYNKHLNLHKTKYENDLVKPIENVENFRNQLPSWAQNKIEDAPLDIDNSKSTNLDLISSSDELESVTSYNNQIANTYLANKATTHKQNDQPAILSYTNGPSYLSTLNAPLSLPSENKLNFNHSESSPYLYQNILQTKLSPQKITNNASTHIVSTPNRISLSAKYLTQNSPQSINYLGNKETTYNDTGKLQNRTTKHLDYTPYSSTQHINKLSSPSLETKKNLMSQSFIVTNNEREPYRPMGSRVNSTYLLNQDKIDSCYKSYPKHQREDYMKSQENIALLKQNKAQLRNVLDEARKIFNTSNQNLASHLTMYPDNSVISLKQPNANSSFYKSYAISPSNRRHSQPIYQLQSKSLYALTHADNYIPEPKRESSLSHYSNSPSSGLEAQSESNSPNHRIINSKSKGTTYSPHLNHIRPSNFGLNPMHNSIITTNKQQYSHSHLNATLPAIFDDETSSSILSSSLTPDEELLQRDRRKGLDHMSHNDGSYETPAKWKSMSTLPPLHRSMYQNESELGSSSNICGRLNLYKRSPSFKDLLAATNKGVSVKHHLVDFDNRKINFDNNKNCNASQSTLIITSKTNKPNDVMDRNDTSQLSSLTLSSNIGGETLCKTSFDNQKVKSILPKSRKPILSRFNPNKYKSNLNLNESIYNHETSERKKETNSNKINDYRASLPNLANLEMNVWNMDLNDSSIKDQQHYLINYLKDLNKLLNCNLLSSGLDEQIKDLNTHIDSIYIKSHEKLNNDNPVNIVTEHNSSTHAMLKILETVLKLKLECESYFNRVIVSIGSIMEKTMEQETSEFPYETNKKIQRDMLCKIIKTHLRKHTLLNRSIMDTTDKILYQN